MRKINEDILNRNILDIKQEFRHATQEFGAFNSLHEGYAILLEEVDELWDEIKKKTLNLFEVRTEAKHVAAMALRILYDMEALK